MINKKSLIAAAVFAFVMMFSQNGFSQYEVKKTPEDMATKIAERMKTNLSLSDDQYKQVYEMALTHAKQKIENKEKFQNLDSETRKQMRKQSKEEFRKQLETILNPDQITKLNQMKEKHKNKNKNKNKNKTKLEKKSE